MLACVVPAVLYAGMPRPIHGFVTFVVLAFWAWLAHLMMHTFDVPVFTRMHSVHHGLAPHHPLSQKCNINPGVKEKLQRALTHAAEFCTEAALNFAFVGGVFWLLLPDTIVHHGMVLFFSIMYTSYHMINYHVTQSAVHKDHHEYIHANYGPAFIDAIMGTHMPPEFEDVSHYIPNAIVTTVLLALYRALQRSTPYRV